MEEIEKLVAKFVANWIDVTVPILLVGGLMILIVTLMSLGIRMIACKTSAERVEVIDGLSWCFKGLLILGIVMPIASFLLYRLFN